MKADLKLKKTDITSLVQEENKSSWQEKYCSFKSQKGQIENEINKLKIGSNNSNNIKKEEDYMNLNKKVGLSKLSCEQVMKRGETNKELNKQMEDMDRINEDLNEMDGSLNKTKKMISYMNKIV